MRLVLPAIVGALAIALVLAIVLGTPSKGSSDASISASGPQSSGGFDGALFPAGVRAPDFTLEDQQGHRVSLSAYSGQVVALIFLPSPSCRTCLLVAQQVRGALDELEGKPQVKAVFVSTKTGATRARVARFLAETSLTGRAEYLTGTAKQLGGVTRAYRLPPPSASKATAEAAVTVLLRDRDGFERVGFGLEQITPEGLSHDIRRLQAG
jgi:protein SCO1/2